ncbi:MAG: hypothetical protein EOO75_12835, partial [Myxococcales bacterium]
RLRRAAGCPSACRPGRRARPACCRGGRAPRRCRRRRPRYRPPARPAATAACGPCRRRSRA